MNSFIQLVATAWKNIVALVTGVTSPLAKFAPHALQTHNLDFSVEVVRPNDLLVLTLDFYNLRITNPGPSPKLEPQSLGNSFIVVHFPPQSFAEQAFLEDAAGMPAEGEDTLPLPPVISRISGPSQLVFQLPDSLLPLDFKLENILDALTESEPIVQPRIQPPPPPTPVGGLAEFFGTRSQFSAIEAPFRLILSPNIESRWAHASGVVKKHLDSNTARSELWHTRLSGTGKTVSAVWSPDYNPQDPPPANDTHPFRMSLHAENRHQIVRSTSDPELPGAKPANVARLMLSSQGAWMNLHGEWDAEVTGLSLVEWRHLMTAGRDHYVKVVKEGTLFHFGHRAVFIKITERKIQKPKEGPLGAYLRQRYFIVVREPTKTYQHRHVPFRTVTIKSLVTPNLDAPSDHDILGLKENAFWPCVLKNDFEFHIVATDWEGREIEFHTPLAFIARDVSQADVLQIVNIYNVTGFESEPIDVLNDLPHRLRSMGGQKIAFAQSQASGDTTLETQSLLFNAMKAPGFPGYLPRMWNAKVDVPAVRQITGNAALSTIAFPKTYYESTGDNLGDQNLGEVFAQLVDTTPVSFTADKTGGMVAPNFGITGISRGFGPVGGDIKNFAEGKFNPKDVFPNITLLGGISLSSIVPDFIGSTPSAAGTKIPQLKTIRTEAEVNGELKPVLQTSYKWELVAPNLWETDLFQPDADATFYISSTVNVPLDGTAPETEIKGGLKNFAVTLIPPPTPLPSPPPIDLRLIALKFTAVEFVAKPNAKVDFSVIFKGFEFIGLLAFVNKLKDVIPMDGFEDPPFLDLVLPPDPRPGVKVGYTLAIPTVGIGIFTLQNISLGASFYLPFIGDPASLRLEFCQRHQPFTLTVSLFGGGGFFAIDIGFKGVQMIEAALEFGAAIALNLGVASGSACVMAGVYYQRRDDGFAIAAYFRAAGSLSVLGIITVSVELYVSLNYESNKAAVHGGKLWGQASLTVKVKIAFFSKKVSISIEREFAGSDPKFIDTVKPDHWKTYCAAFAKA